MNRATLTQAVAGKTGEPLGIVGKKSAGRLLDGREWSEMPG